MVKKAQYKIQQMAFMILAIFFFFVLVGIFFIGWQYAGLRQEVAFLHERKAFSGLKVVADTPELHCDAHRDFCIDKDKLTAFSENSHLYKDFWSVASIEVLMVHPKRDDTREYGEFDKDYEPVLCPQPNCDYYILYDSGQKNKKTVSAYVNVCSEIERGIEVCELAKLMLGVFIYE